MAWWIWVLVAFLLMGLELATTTLHLAFFGGGALIVALLVGLGVGGPLWVQLLVFTLSSLVLLMFRRHLLSLMKFDQADRDVDPIVGESAVALEEIAVSGSGKAELRGTAWSARNAGDRPVQRGERCRVEKIEGLTLWVRPL